MENHNNYAEKPYPKTKPTSNSDLMSSAKVLADAAKSAYSKESDKIDKAKVAGAAADFIGAAKHYGKFEDKNFGKYVDKAESYLHSYHSSSPAPSHAPGGNVPQGHAPGAGAGDGYGGGKPHYQSSSHAPSHGPGGNVPEGHGHFPGAGAGDGYGGGKPQGGGGHSSGGAGGYGEYIKLAQGLLKKDDHGNSGGGGGSGGSGDYIKLAQGLFNKKH